MVESPSVVMALMLNPSTDGGSICGSPTVMLFSGLLASGGSVCLVGTSSSSLVVMLFGPSADWGSVCTSFSSAVVAWSAQWVPLLLLRSAPVGLTFPLPF